MPVSRRNFLKAGAAAAVATGLPAAARQNSDKMNLLWIMTDQQPLDMMGAYGHPHIETPNMDRIAKEGMRFDNMHIAAFPCSPSRACFITGRHSHNHRVITNDIPLPEDIDSLGDILDRAGYDTAWIGKWHLSGHMYRNQPGRRGGMDGNWKYQRVENPDYFRHERVPGGTGEDAPAHGFRHWRGGWEDYRGWLRKEGLGELVDTTPVGNHNDLPSGPDSTHSVSKLDENHHMAAYFSNEAVSFLEKRKESDNPFAMVVSYYGPHLPVAPPAPWDEKYALDQVTLPDNHYDNLKGKPLKQRANKRCYALPDWTDDQFRDYIRRYQGYISYIDHQTGRILDALEAAGELENTIILFTTDHGDMAGAHGFVFKLGWCGYDELLRVPFLLRCPGRIPADSSCDALTSSVDVLPTLLEMMDVPAPDGIDGKSMAPLLGDTGKDFRDAAVCNSMENNLTLVHEDWKYVLNWQPRDRDELYDLTADPEEMHNRAEEEACSERLIKMQARLRRWLEDTGHPYRHTILKAMTAPAEIKMVQAWPEVTAFRHTGDNTFEYEYIWHCDAPIPGSDRYWSFTHFASSRYGKDGDIAFRDTTWPEPPTTEWEKGGAYKVGPVKVTIPNHAGSGKYDVHIGLYNPEKRSSPGHFEFGNGNSCTVGTLEIQKKDGAIKSLKFTPVYPVIKQPA